MFVVHPSEGLVRCLQSFGLVAAGSGCCPGSPSSGRPEGVGAQPASPSGPATEGVEEAASLVVAAGSAAGLSGCAELASVEGGGDAVDCAAELG